MTQDIYQYKSYLFSVAYNLLGEIQPAEDAVHDVFEKWLTANKTNIKNEKAYLRKMVVNYCMDVFEQLKKEREIYKGVWLPEPVISEQTESGKDITLDYAMLFMLERLNPYERAVFVLRTSFDMDYQEIAELLNVSYDNCRQIYHRAKNNVRNEKKATKIDNAHQKDLIEAFLLATYQQSLEQLQQILKADVELYSDGGGKVAAALKPLFGLEKVAKFLIGIARIPKEGEVTYKPVYMNNQFGALILLNNEPESLLTIEYTDNQITRLFFVRNPDKIHYKVL